jgi:hypothetical protein
MKSNALPNFKADLQLASQQATHTERAQIASLPVDMTLIYKYNNEQL